MPEILHRISIDAPTAHVHDLIASTGGVGSWWSGRPAEGDAAVGGRFGVLFGDADKPAAVMHVVTDTPEEVSWQVEVGPQDWIGTRITFALHRHSDNRTTLLFTHSGWAEPNEFMGGCTSNWGAYLTSLKQGAETGTFAAFPQGEVSRWDTSPQRLKNQITAWSTAKVMDQEETLAELGRYIRAQRELTQMSLRHFAKMVNVSDSYLSQVERGLYQPSGEVLSAISKGLGLSPDALFRRLGWMPEADAGEPGVLDAIAADSKLGKSQKAAMAQMYKAMTEDS